MSGSTHTHMAAEMAQQPAVLAHLAQRRGEHVARLQSVLPPRLRGVCFAARGSSDNAALYGRYLVERAARVPTSLTAPSVSTRADTTVDYTDWLGIVVSQSGRTPEMVTMARSLRAGGARLVVVVNDETSPLSEAADVIVPLEAGPELAVPATKTFTAQLATMALLAEALEQQSWASAAWEHLAQAVTSTVTDDAPAAAAAEVLDHDRVITVGRGTMYAVAMEAALKLKETAACGAEGFAVPDLLHGPIAGFSPDVPVVAFAGDSTTDADVAELVDRLRQRGHRVLLVAPSATADLPLPALPLGPLLALPATVRAQQLALHLALRRGLDVDAPRDLAKVTATR